MKLQTNKGFALEVQIIFDTFCLLAAISTISYCIHTYLLDEDSTSVEFKQFDANHHERGYPSFTLCFLDPFLKMNYTPM